MTIEKLQIIGLLVALSCGGFLIGMIIILRLIFGKVRRIDTISDVGSNLRK